MIWSTRDMLLVRAARAGSFSTFCAGGSGAAGNMASVVQERCVLQGVFVAAVTGF